ncbi:MAG TPA: hypothetical protein VK277_12295 [Acidimicrobiales bacterium]|nr:hypothetical protein [Acidimicrobiales bacterium]
MSSPNWAEEVTAIATALGALGLLGAIGAAIFAGQQVREARRSSQAQMAADFFRRWDEPELVETRRFVDRYDDDKELAAAFQGFIAAHAPEAYILYRELDYFEQLAALEIQGAFDFELVRLMLGRTLIDRYEMWRPSLQAMGEDVYPLFGVLVAKLRDALSVPERPPRAASS